MAGSAAYDAGYAASSDALGAGNAAHRFSSHTAHGAGPTNDFCAFLQSYHCNLLKELNVKLAVHKLEAATNIAHHLASISSSLKGLTYRAGPTKHQLRSAMRRAKWLSSTTPPTTQTTIHDAHRPPPKLYVHGAHRPPPELSASRHHQQPRRYHKPHKEQELPLRPARPPQRKRRTETTPRNNHQRTALRQCRNAPRQTRVQGNRASDAQSSTGNQYESQPQADDVQPDASNSTHEEQFDCEDHEGVGIADTSDCDYESRDSWNAATEHGLAVGNDAYTDGHSTEDHVDETMESCCKSHSSDINEWRLDNEEDPPSRDNYVDGDVEPVRVNIGSWLGQYADLTGSGTHDNAESHRCESSYEPINSTWRSRSETLPCPWPASSYLRDGSTYYDNNDDGASFFDDPGDERTCHHAYYDVQSAYPGTLESHEDSEQPSHVHDLQFDCPNYDVDYDQYDHDLRPDSHEFDHDLQFDCHEYDHGDAHYNYDSSFDYREYQPQSSEHAANSLAAEDIGFIEGG